MDADPCIARTLWHGLSLWQAARRHVASGWRSGRDVEDIEYEAKSISPATKRPNSCLPLSSSSLSHPPTSPPPSHTPKKQVPLLVGMCAASHLVAVVRYKEHLSDDLRVHECQRVAAAVIHGQHAKVISAVGSVEVRELGSHGGQQLPPFLCSRASGKRESE